MLQKNSWFIVFLFFLPACDWFTQKPAQGRAAQETITISHTVAPNAILSISNIDGSITIKGVDSAVVKITATKSGLPEDIEQIKIVSDLSKEAVTISTEDMRAKKLFGITYSFDVNQTRPVVDYVVEVPKGNSVYLNNKRGDIRISDITGDSHIFVDRGDVALNNTGVADVGITRGNLTAHDVTNILSAVIDKGKIQAEVKKLPQRRGQFLMLETKKGDIILTLPQNPNAFISALSKGSINSQFPLHLQTSRMRRSKTIKGVLGKGGPKIELRNKHGNIEINK